MFCCDLLWNKEDADVGKEEEEGEEMEETEEREVREKEGQEEEGG